VGRAGWPTGQAAEDADLVEAPDDAAAAGFESDEDELDELDDEPESDDFAPESDDFVSDDFESDEAGVADEPLDFAVERESVR
jgi:hypothetical protein